MKWFLFVFISVFQSTTICAQEKAASLRALIVCDTSTPDFSKSSHADAQRMKESLEGIAYQTGLKLRLNLLEGNTLTAANIQHWVRSLPKSSKDVAFIYYSGHSARSTKQQGRWPALNVSSPNCNHQKGGFEVKIIEGIKKRHPRLAIILFDTYRKFITPEDGIILPQQNPVICKEKILPGLKTLFLRSKGFIIARSECTNQIGLGSLSAKPIGGVFTTSFLLALNSISTREATGWGCIRHMTFGILNESKAKQGGYFNVMHVRGPRFSQLAKAFSASTPKK